MKHLILKLQDSNNKQIQNIVGGNYRQPKYAKGCLMLMAWEI